MRLFISVELPADLKKKLASFSSKLHGLVAGSFVPINNYHITLRFLGEISEENAAQVKKACKDALAEEKGPLLYLGGIKVFPSKNFVKIISVGTTNDALLKKIYDKLDKKLDALGFKAGHSFDSHITLVRVHQVLKKLDLEKFFDENKNVKLGCFDIADIKLMKSELGAQNAVYSEVASFKLA